MSTATGLIRVPLSVRGDDLYETPPVAVRALLDAEKFGGTVWEPACGRGAIVDVLRASGHRVWATDLVDWGCVDSEHGVDFLMERQLPDFHVGSIVTNPPYKLASEFAEHALWLGVPKVCLLLRLAFLESCRRSGILEGGWLRRVHVFRRRLPMMHREGWTGKQARSSVAYAWFVWEAGPRGPCELRRV